MTSLSAQERSILAVLETTQAITVAEIATALEMTIHPMTVDRHCRALQRAGYVNRRPGGAYTLTCSGASVRQAAAD
ncbi:MULTISPECIES: MarR family transcriptional regulator [Natrialba]|uniref:HTH marR-type domain-containing protein n=2 Tax=Natrialba TaxID=63742 RepID=M0AYG3_9EURY|nr:MULTISPECIES: MarR family transcriptional regulator [Natrialba]ELY95820.1 hypothetical protein C484_02464 [Natrialba taiwanensis DSM 12281]ELZ03736.1 hypothetical protein C480_15265 [Natrialba aegyptia DSM 13077]